MNRGNFQKPRVDIPSPDKEGEEIDIDLFNLNTTTWSQLAEYNNTEGLDAFGEFDKLSPLHQASPRKKGADIDIQGMLPPAPPSRRSGKTLMGGGNAAGQGVGRTAAGEAVGGGRGEDGNQGGGGGSVVFTSYSNSGITPSMSTMVQTPSHYFETSPTFAQLKDSQINYGSSNFWGSTRNFTSRVGWGVKNGDGGFSNDGFDDDDEYLPEKPLSARGKQIFFEHISGGGGGGGGFGGGGSGGETTRKRTSTAKSGGGGGGGGRSGGVSNKSNIARKAKEAAKIAHNQYPGSPELVSPERRCKCKKSKCLKLYCECFAAHVYCTPGACRCIECNNLQAFEGARVGAIESALSRNINAFTNKVTKAEKRASMTKSTGCNCKKSLCLKKYCECFFTGMLCTSECKCINCENYSGSVALANKREQMKKDMETASLVKDLGAAAAQAVRNNGVNPEEAKRNAIRVREEQSRRRQAILAAQQQIDRRQETIGQERDEEQQRLSRQMGGLGVSPRSAAAAASAAAVATNTGSGTYKDFTPGSLGLGDDDDWEFAAEIAADIINMEALPESTKSLSGKSPAHKKGRMFSPKTQDFMHGGGGRKGSGKTFTF